jgi:hypothetical protein
VGSASTVPTPAVEAAKNLKKRKLKIMEAVMNEADFSVPSNERERCVDSFAENTRGLR